MTSPLDADGGATPCAAALAMDISLPMAGCPGGREGERGEGADSASPVDFSAGKEGESDSFGTEYVCISACRHAENRKKDRTRETRFRTKGL